MLRLDERGDDGDDESGNDTFVVWYPLGAMPGKTIFHPFDRGLPM